MNQPANTLLSAVELTAIFGQSIESLQTLTHTQRLDEKSQAIIYSMACSQMQAGRHEQASKYFQFLSFYAPSNADYLQALGLCATQLEQWELAAHALGTALYLQPESFALALAWSEALLHLGMPKIAKEILRMVAADANAPEDALVQQRAQMLLQSLQEKIPAYAAA